MSCKNRTISLLNASFCRMHWTHFVFPRATSSSLALLLYNYLVRCRQLTRNATCWSVAMVHLIKLKICFVLRLQQQRSVRDIEKNSTFSVLSKKNKQPQTFFFRLHDDTMAHPPFTYLIMKPQQHMCAQMSTHILKSYIRCFHSVQPQYEEHWTTTTTTSAEEQKNI